MICFGEECLTRCPFESAMRLLSDDSAIEEVRRREETPSRFLKSNAARG